MADDPTPPPDPTVALTPAPRERVPVAFAVAPKTVDEAYRLAQAFARSGLVPQAYRGNPDDIFVAVQMGTEVGLPPFTALQSIAVVKGRPGLYGDGFLAVVMASPHYAGHDAYLEVEHGDGLYQRVDTLTDDDLKVDTTRGFAEFRRQGHDPKTATFSIADAKRAELWGKEGWRLYPQRMLRWRAIEFAARDAFPDVLKGIKSVYELADTPPDQDAPPVPRVVRRRSDAPTPEDRPHDAR